jgi:competence ComEA-like helix-hairpin-helix protein
VPDSRVRRCLELWAILTGVLLVHAFADGVLRADRERTPAVIPCRIDLNRAPVGELMALPGFGRARAAAVVLHRVRHGPFRSVDDLGMVDGIGAEVLAGVRPFVFVGAADDR